MFQDHKKVCGVFEALDQIFQCKCVEDILSWYIFLFRLLKQKILKESKHSVEGEASYAMFMMTSSHIFLVLFIIKCSTYLSFRT